MGRTGASLVDHPVPVGGDGVAKRLDCHDAPGRRRPRGSTKVSVVDYGGVLALVPALGKPVQQAAGMLKGRTSLTGALLTEHKGERSRGR